ncbi:pancreatic secretory granule membrane major glycoprotein GP2-like [Protopterus annectens]|uniref:pancreatic secretory granule membrane major glycoprotein GP2-like n=1 Tax=Protopterus annectens TaxID=7888 RepID=UPI001CFBD1A5|nr:pancreatic secretory granule membrane major glycoprotein GP2-like [Protopterus annectens]
MKTFLGIILTIGLIKEVYLQCEDTCLYDEECLPFTINETTHYSCECKAAIYNANTDFLLLLRKVPVYCSPNQFAIKLTSCLGRGMSASNILLPDENTVDNQCFSRSEPANFSVAEFDFNFSSTTTNCQATILTNSTHVTYSVPVWFRYNNTGQTVITHNDILVTYNCSYPLTMNSSLDVGLEPYKSSNNITVTGSGTYTTIVQLNKFANYTGAYTTAEMPLQLAVESPLYITASVLGADPKKFSLKVDSCYGTPSSDRNDPVRFDIITYGCPVQGSPAVSLDDVGNSLDNKLSMKVFKFSHNPEVYLHFVFSLCLGTCPPSCSSRSERVETDNAKTNLTVGPIHVNSAVLSDLTPPSDSAPSSVFSKLWILMALPLLLIKSI